MLGYSVVDITLFFDYSSMWTIVSQPHDKNIILGYKEKKEGKKVLKVETNQF